MGGGGNWFFLVREVCMGPSRTIPLWAILAGSGPAKAILPTWLKPAPRLAVPAQGEDGPGLNPPRASPAVWIEIFPVLAKASVKSASDPFRTHHSVHLTPMMASGVLTRKSGSFTGKRRVTTACTHPWRP